MKYYYTDELNDDFAGNNIKQKPLPDDYKYFSECLLRKTLVFIFYHFIVTPIVFVLQKVVYRERIVGKKKVRKYLKSGFYLYGNHTRAMGDAYSPCLISFPKKAYVVTNPDAVSIPLIKRLVEDLGAMPVPSSIAGMRNFNKAILRHSENGDVIAIYPEAHIWPMYTGIRHFKATSFRYPVETGKPVFTFTTTYQRCKLLPVTKTMVFVDGPFFPDKSLTSKEQAENLRKQAFGVMVSRSHFSTYTKNEFIKKESDELQETELKPYNNQIK